ncbi:ACN9-domain-containing protein [Dothidotthia symphoricarpi CBS 119687]|uniref:Succinate dehydrogenase assembly factor 3 n=1 Tax=Dothidotthia symphoricarpi CBS 119687 TaxID=1392245 RepID=A0A6A6AFG0_9PLEO|nr:ACN9-domain-containing protein [Dothidotthia symphoricarpi CBS 119687]KAF2129855.1 ACN9-domain-containing protein [Dothidotthia symphoricarpi CBS 119687]
MRPCTRLLAVATDAGSSRPFRPAPMALLPPIPLYRRLLRSHRKRLGVEERMLGDMYIKAEFRAHRDVENPVQIIGFLTEWQLYAQMLEGDSWRGDKMDKAKIDKMSGMFSLDVFCLTVCLWEYRSADWPAVRAHAANQETRPARCI